MCLFVQSSYAVTLPAFKNNGLFFGDLNQAEIKLNINITLNIEEKKSEMLPWQQTEIQ